MQTFAQLGKKPLSLKEKAFCLSFIAFLKSTCNLEHFQKKRECDTLSMNESIDFRTAFGNKRVNGLETLLKSVRHYYRPIFP